MIRESIFDKLRKTILGKKESNHRDYNTTIKSCYIIDPGCDSWNNEPEYMIAKADVYWYNGSDNDIDQDAFGSGEFQYEFSESDIIGQTCPEKYQSLFSAKHNKEFLKYDNDFTGETGESWIKPFDTLEEAKEYLFNMKGSYQWIEYIFNKTHGFHNSFTKLF